jgi:hypothetical protein
MGIWSPSFDTFEGKGYNMKPSFPLFLLLALAGCAGNGSYHKAEDAQEAAREFVRASLDGDYDKARFYLFQDSANVNQMLLDKWKSDYDRLPQEDKVNFKQSNILVIGMEPAGDSATNFTYSNTYKRKNTTIKVIRSQGDWLIDLKDIH